MDNFKDLTVDSFTTPCPICVAANTSLAEVIEIMDKEGVRHIPVQDESEKIIGLITHRDVNALRAFNYHQPLFAGDVMVDGPQAVMAGSPLIDAAFKMSEDKIGSVLVLDEQGKLEGIFTSTDALNALVEVLRGEVIS